MEQVAHGQPDALHALIGAVEAKDPYTHGHSARVADLSTRIGLRLALEPDAVRGLHQGAFLHDVGKISVPDQILNKPGDLDPDEWEQIQRHPEVGWDLVSRADSLRGALSAIRHHHERWDGTGYPDRLGGTDIPLPGSHRRGGRRLGRPHLRPRVPSGLGPRPRGVACRRGERNPVRSGVRRGVPRRGGRERAWFPNAHAPTSMRSLPPPPTAIPTERRPAAGLGPASPRSIQEPARKP